MSDALGRGKIGQRSIGEKVNIDQIKKLFQTNLNKFEKIVQETNDNHAKDLLIQLRDENKLSLPINKHVEMFILKNKKDPIKIIKYLIFRYKFYIAGKNKINLGYPPYLLIEPVSACNLRCPFCFQNASKILQLKFFTSVCTLLKDVKSLYWINFLQLSFNN